MPHGNTETLLTVDPAVAAKFIRGGGTCAFPTETVFGLGADAFNGEAVAKIFAAKQRPADNPLIIHIAEIGQIDEVAADLTDEARLLIQQFFPGPLTVVVPKAESIPLIATAGLNTIGVRMPRHPVAIEFLKKCGVPVAAPSANLSGRPSPTTWQAVFEDLNGRIDCLLQGELTEIGLESTVVDCTVEGGLILRPGAISLEEVRTVLPSVRTLADSDKGPAKSPGLNHRHYSPTARIQVVEPNESFEVDISSAFIGLVDPQDAARFKLVVRPASIEMYARELFEFFRECDRRRIAAVYCESVAETGIGSALMDRVRRAVKG